MPRHISRVGFCTILVILSLAILCIAAQLGWTSLDSSSSASSFQKQSSGYYDQQTLHELEKQGRMEGMGVRFFHNTPEPTAKPITLTKGQSKAIPDEWDWRLHANLHSQSITQRAPNWCGGCFAFAAMSSLSDRYMIQFPNQFPNTILSVQEALNCATPAGFGYVGCSGSQFERVFSYIQSYGVVDETCNPYLGVERAFTVLGADCWENQCRSCTSDGTCTMVKAKKWGVANWGVISGEEEMKYHIYTGGPIACYIQTHVPTYVDYKSGIMTDASVFQPYEVTHVVSVIGYGSENGTPYWLARNWAGNHWGENGNFRVFRGNNTMNLEWRCGYGTPNPDAFP